MSLRIGRIAYLNVAPYFHYLPQQGFAEEVVLGVPSELNSMLATGQLDACPSSSFEYGLHAQDYLLLPGHSISSVGPVHSVLLFTPGPLASLCGGDVAITGESATSINLLKILLSEFCGVDDLTFRVPDEPVEASLAKGQSALLIGDRALAASRDCGKDCMVTDLGALWYHFTGLPFVFALWILRRDAAEKYPEQVRSLVKQLDGSRRYAFAHLPEMAGNLSAGTGFSVRQLEDYWRSMSYELTEGHLEGLKLYFALCQKHDLLDEMPELQFFS